MGGTDRGRSEEEAQEQGWEGATELRAGHGVLLFKFTTVA
jgi:hypothetical protein